MNNPFKKEAPKFMTESELADLKEKIKSREEEFELRQKQAIIESGFKKSNSFNFNPEKLKKGAIIVVVGLALTFIVIKIIGKFI